ncbi:helix-turn-helix transcriptional regulator [Ferroglobus placidus]|uniref:helix-turn-helix transcriptional regulator n=1 Tax=Ferroglobus placidus TaxID=54261 RepID=UPI00145F65D3|nr:transcriptional regulator FilR1 domain-containing protein [Ferroglobus placidus]
MDIAINEKTINILEAVEKNDFSSVKKKYPKSTLYHLISKLKSENLIEKRDDEYCLTHRGSVYLKMLRKFGRCMEKFQEISKMFPEHVVEFPEEFVMRLDELECLEVISADKTNVLRPLRVLTNLITQSKEIRAVSPMFYPDYPSVFEKIVEKMKGIELVVSENVWKLIEIYDHTEDFSEKFSVYVVNEQPELAVTVSDVFLSMNFYRSSGDLDFLRTLISKNERALKFGSDLFEFYREQAEKVL